MRFDDFTQDYATRGKLVTAKTYHRLLDPFDKWLVKRGLTKAFTINEVNAYLADRPKWTNSTRNSFLAALRSWATREKSITPAGNDINEVVMYRAIEKNLDAIAAMKSYTITVAARQPLTLDEIRAILRAASNSSFDFQCIWSLFWTGARSNELTAIKPSDIKEIEDGNVEVTINTLKTGSIGVTRTLYGDPFAAMCLRSMTDPVTREYTKLEPGPMLSRYAWAVKRHLHPHLARHTFASFMGLLVRDRVLSEPGLSYLLGHAAPSMTQAYVHPFADELKVAMLSRHYMKALEPPDFKHGPT